MKTSIDPFAPVTPPPGFSATPAPKVDQVVLYCNGRDTAGAPILYPAVVRWVGPDLLVHLAVYLPDGGTIERKAVPHDPAGTLGCWLVPSPEPTEEVDP